MDHTFGNEVGSDQIQSEFYQVEEGERGYVWEVEAEGAKVMDDSWYHSWYGNHCTYLDDSVGNEDLIVERWDEKVVVISPRIQRKENFVTHMGRGDVACQMLAMED